MSNIPPFDDLFAALTGHAPFPWQRRLFELFAEGRWPECKTCALPTGLGKTAVIPIWLMALAENPGNVPRRLVYVVNRRTVVDQTTNEVERLRSALASADGVLCDLQERLQLLRGPARAAANDLPLAISTLRGQFADNHEWSADPARPAVIVGTVDMIGSRLLFSGYGVGFKARPLHAGFLGQDALIVHDEAHLEPAFQCLLEKIEEEQNKNEPHRPSDFRPLRVMQLTATTRGTKDSKADAKPFELTEEEKNPPDAIPEPTDDEPPIYKVWRRFEAKRHLVPHPVSDDSKVADEIAKRALELGFAVDVAGNRLPRNVAMLVFVRTLEDVKKVCDRLTNRKDGVPGNHVQPLTGTMRGLERDRMADPRRPDASRVFARFLRRPKADAPEDERWKTDPMPGTVYLVCTSAGEVGIDISADHMVCDLSTFESMAQRLGRVNRYGERDDTRVDVVYPEKFDDKDKLKPAREATLSLLRQLKQIGQDKDGHPIYDASPKALRELWERTDLPCKIEDAFSPPPTILSATDILFDAWSLTTIKEKMPGRPDVAPYLHGIADDLPQTIIAWRAELDLIDRKLPKAENEKALNAIFTKHRIRPHESMTVGMSNQRGKWRFRAIEFLEQMVMARPELRDAPMVIQFSRNLRLATIGELIDNPGPLSADPTLVLPASFGGIDDKGMLDISKPDSKKKKRDVVDNDTTDENLVSATTPTSSLDVADIKGYERKKNMKPRLRVLIERTDDGWFARAVPGSDPLPDDWNLESPPETSTPLIQHIREQSGLRVRHVQALQFDGEDDPVCSLVCLSPVSAQQPREEQALDEHVAAVEGEAKQLADALKLEEPYHSALLFAAKWHDEGKKAPIWQRYIGGPNDNGEPLGKSAEWRDPELLAGYRHEFGSLLRINPHQPDNEDVCELALHMIAAHHGHARPHFSHTFDRDFTTQQTDQTQIDAIRRFAKLQRKYGRWVLAYLESLLRAADIAASAGFETDDEVEEFDGGDA